MKRKRVYKFIVIACMLLMVGAVIEIVQSFWQIESQEEVKEERIVTMLLRESSQSLGLDRMIKKVYVEEKIRVDVQIIPDNQADSIIRMKVNTGEVPDILDYDIPYVYGLIEPELYLEDLSDAMWVERLTDTENVEYEDGNIYSFPLQESSGLGGIIYNKAVFEAYGLEVPDCEEAYMEVCQKLQENGITPVLMCSDIAIPRMWMEYGIPLAYGSGTACVSAMNSLMLQSSNMYDYSQNIEPMEAYLSLFEMGYVNQDFQNITYEEMCERMSQGSGAMILGNFNTVSDIEYLDQEVELGMFPIPFDYNVDLDYIVATESKGFVVFKDGNNMETAKEVLELWSTPEYLDLWYMDYGGIPAFEDVDMGPINQELWSEYEAYIDTHEEVNGLTMYALPLYNLVTTKFWLYYIEAPLNGDTGYELAQRCQMDISEYLY